MLGCRQRHEISKPTRSCVLLLMFFKGGKQVGLGGAGAGGILPSRVAAWHFCRCVALARSRGAETGWPRWRKYYSFHIDHINTPVLVLGKKITQHDAFNNCPVCPPASIATKLEHDSPRHGWW